LEPGSIKKKEKWWRQGGKAVVIGKRELERMVQQGKGQQRWGRKISLRTPSLGEQPQCTEKLDEWPTSGLGRKNVSVIKGYLYKN